MGKHATHPSVAKFDSSFLRNIASAFASRAKALKYQSSRFVVTRAHSDGNETLNLELDTLEDRPTRLRLIIWADSAMWLAVHQPGPSAQGGWDFSFETNGYIATTSAKELVPLVERTRAIVFGPTRATDAKDAAAAIWTAATRRVSNQPETETSTS
jgi:hypothetical protein